MLLALILPVVLAATLRGTIYDAQLNPEPKVLVEINTTPHQQFLARDGSYQFTLSPGWYTLTASKEPITLQEQLEINQEGEFVYDLFLVPDIHEEEELLQQTEEDLLEGTGVLEEGSWWWYIPGAVLMAALLLRVLSARKKYGKLPSFWKKKIDKIDSSVPEVSEDQALARVLEIIQKHEGRITQKELRQEMMPLSEAKVSLLVTELEHKGKIEKIKKGRGNVIILK